MNASGETLRSSLLSGDLEIIPPQPSKIVRIFVSSTFGDTIAERNALLDRAYPALHDWCVLHDVEFQVVDMRWGVRDEASAYHMTTELCIREIRNCMRLSLGPNFMFILGQRYGWRPCQASIDATDYQTLLEFTSSEESTLLAEWYLLDENSAPPIYVLQPITKEKTEAWKSAEKELPNVLRRAATLAANAGVISDDVRHKYFMSVTEQELRAALEVSNPDNHCVGFMRTLNNLYSSTSDVNARRYCDMTSKGELDEDARQLLQKLKTVDTPSILNPRNIHYYSIPWTKAGVSTSDEEHCNYLRQFTKAFVEDVKRLVLKAKEKASMNNGLGQDLQIKEVLHHAEFCRNKCKSFCGCEDTLDKIFTAIGVESRHHTVVVHGLSGSGKTSIMAVVAKRAREHLGPSTVIILRFLGTSSQSSSIFQVLKSICLQVCSVYDLAPPSHNILENFQEVAAFFLNTLQCVCSGEGKERPLLIMLDSLDQLQSFHGAHKCKWLPRTRLPNVHIILSTLPTLHGILENLKFLSADEGCFVAVNPLPESTGVEIFSTWMKEIHRRITKDQSEIVRKAFRLCRQPLFLKLAFEEARRWKSYTEVSEEALATTVRAAIWKLFARLEVEFGAKVVSHALGYITAARNGLSHSELEDILSIDDEVLDEIYQYWSPPSDEFVRIPPLMWTRLKHELEEYLVERQTDGKTVMVLYHRQFTEAARDRYLCDPDEKRLRHQVMAEFFAGTWSAGQKKTLHLSQRKEVFYADRLVAPQPLKRHRSYNYRRLSELPYHLLHAHNTMDLVSQTFGNFAFLDAMVLALSAQHLIEELNWVLEMETILGKNLHTELTLLQDTIRLAKSTLDFQDNRQPLAVEILGRLTHLAADYPQCIGSIVQGAREQCSRSRETLLVPTKSCFYMPGGPLRTTLVGHSGNIEMVAVNHSCSMLATASTESSVRLWELESDENIHVLKGQKGGTMTCVAISPDDQWIVAGSDQNYLQVWSIVSGDPVLLIDENHYGYLRHASIAVTYDSTRIVSSSKNDLMIYDIITGDRLHAFRGHTDLISCICISSDDRYAVTGSDDKTVKVWSLVGHHMICDITDHQRSITYVAVTSDAVVVSASLDGKVVITRIHPMVDKLSSPQTLHILSSPNDQPIYSCCLSPDETRVVAGTVSIAYIWDMVSGRLLHSLGAHDGVIDCVAVTHDNTHLVSGARDDIMVVWEMSSGHKVQTLEGQQAIVSHLALAKHLVVSASLHSPYIKLWDISPKYLKQRSMMFADRSGMVAATTDARYMYVIFKGINPFAKTSVYNIHIWDAMTGVVKHTLHHHSNKVTCLEVSHGNEFAFTGGRDTTVAMWRICTGKLHHVFEHDTEIRSLCIQSDDSHMASLTCNNAVCIWDLKYLKKAALYDAFTESGNITCVALTPHRSMVYGTSSGDLYVKCWSPDTGSVNDLKSLSGQSSAVTSLALSCDGTLLASAYDDPYVVVWHLRTMEKLYNFGRSGSVNCMYFTEDNSFLLTGASDKKVMVWSICDGRLATNLYVYSNLTEIRATTNTVVACTKIGQLMAFRIHLPGIEDENEREICEKRQSLTSFLSYRNSTDSSNSSGVFGSHKLSKFCSVL